MRIFLMLILGAMLAACSVQKTEPKTDSQPNVTVTKKNKGWKLTGSKSHLEFISVKKGTIVETHSFTDLSGVVLPDGGAVILIKLDSLETNIDLRNERMKKYLFETDKLSSIMIKTQIDLTQFASMPIGARKDIDLPVGISMHGHNDEMDIAVVVTRLSDHKVVVESRTPAIIDTDTFGFGDGILKLQELAKLNIIATEVPVIFSLAFER